MADTETEVLVVGAGPVGLTAAAELRRTRLPAPTPADLTAHLRRTFRWPVAGSRSSVARDRWPRSCRVAGQAPPPGGVGGTA
ncbi:hypothetical protein [Kitasatospora purpeofusca]|uniref:hypothetical protein n=1 Tax=Kitasatospora purpeofusca TaxID=67352 RepID=UPI00386C3308|nr:hypothetical protein OIP63_05330 [Kitasatospora purpeofusca]